MTTTVLTQQDRESILAIISGQRDFYWREAHGSDGKKRDFYFARIAEADRLEAIFKSKAKLALEDVDEDDEAEYRAEMEEE